MNVILMIEGREAIPVRALPWLTGWHFSAPEVAEAIAGDLDWPEVVCTYRLVRDHGEFVLAWNECRDSS